MEHSESTSTTHNMEDKENSDDDSFNRSDAKECKRSYFKKKQQIRRDSINEGYEALVQVVPALQVMDPKYKMTKTMMVQKAIDYIEYINRQQKQFDKDRISLEKEVLALRIIKTNYEQMFDQRILQLPEEDQIRLSKDGKFRIFEAIMEEMFTSFDKLPMENFEELAGGVIRWMEEHCNPINIRKVVDRALADFKAPLGSMAHPSSSKEQQP